MSPRRAVKAASPCQPSMMAPQSIEMMSPSSSRTAPGMPCTITSLGEAQMTPGNGGWRSRGSSSGRRGGRARRGRLHRARGRDAGPDGGRVSSRASRPRPGRPARILASGLGRLADADVGGLLQHPSAYDGPRPGAAVDGADDPLGDVVGVPEAVDGVEQVPPLVPDDQRLGLLAVEVEAVADRLLGVVFALARRRRRTRRRSSRSGAARRRSSSCRSRLHTRRFEMRSSTTSSGTSRSTTRSSGCLPSR